MAYVEFYYQVNQ